MLNPLLFWVVVDPSLSPFNLTIILPLAGDISPTYNRFHFCIGHERFYVSTRLTPPSGNTFSCIASNVEWWAFSALRITLQRGNLKKDIKKHRSKWTVSVECGNDLSSRQVTLQVLSARWSLTSVFGMRTGGSFRLLSPQWLYNL